MNKCVFPYIVSVRSYERFRFGKWEQVTKYWRKSPRR